MLKWRRQLLKSVNLYIYNDDGDGRSYVSAGM